LRKKPKYLKVDPLCPQPDMIEDAARIINAGGVICFPTTSLYGLGADAFNAHAVDRIFDIKGRSHQKPILILIQNRQELEKLVRRIPPMAENIMQKFWPGKITLVFEAGDNLPSNLTSGTGKIGVRLALHPVAAALIQAVGSPITATSANVSGKPGCAKISNLDAQIADNADLVLDAGELAGGKGSTVIDVTGAFPETLREGTVSASDILNFFNKQG
jgi:L-threonylcarbamoyladenylate synthase